MPSPRMIIMDRREFLTTAGFAAGSGAMALFGGCATPPRTAGAAIGKPTHNQPLLMHPGCQRWSAGKSMWPFYKRHGLRNIVAAGPTDATSLRELREAAEAYGLSLDIWMQGQTNYTMRMTGDQRDRQIERIQHSIQAIGEAGFPCMLYNLTVMAIPARTAPTRGRGGVLYPTWDLDTFLADPDSRLSAAPSIDETWERLEYVLTRIVPVAEEYKVKLACHPQDPPAPPDIAQGTSVALGTVDGLKRFLSIAESDYHGLCFCQGTVCEMLQDPGRELFDVIRYFGKRKKIFAVHFRNIIGGRDRFMEVFPDEGDVDMFKALQVYQEVDYTGMLMPDHVPSHPDDPGGHQAFAYCYGHTLGMLQGLKALPA